MPSIIGGAIGDQPQQQESEVGDEQAIYESFVSAGLYIMSNKDTNPKIIEKLKKGASNPAKVLAETTMLISDMASKEVPDVTLSVALYGSEELLRNVAEFAMASGVFEVDQGIAQEAVTLMLKVMAPKYGVTEEDLAALFNEASDEEIDETAMQYGIESGEEGGA